MKGLKVYWLTVLLTCVLFVAGCGGGGGGSSTATSDTTSLSSKFVGTWSLDAANTQWTGTTKSTGWTGTLVINSNNTFTSKLYNQTGALDESKAGTWAISGTTFSGTVTSVSAGNPKVGDTFSGAITLSNNDNTFTVLGSNNGGKDVWNKINNTSVIGTWALDAHSSTFDPNLVSFTGTLTLNSDGTCSYYLKGPGEYAGGSTQNCTYVLSNNTIAFSSTNSSTFMMLTWNGSPVGNKNPYAITDNGSTLTISLPRNGAEVYHR